MDEPIASADLPLDEDLAQEVKAAAGSALTSIRARRKAEKERLYTDLVVPRYEPPIYVRYGPVDQAQIVAMNKIVEKSKLHDRVVAGNAALLAGAAIGVFEVDEDGNEVSVDPDNREGPWLKFGEELWALLRDDDDPVKPLKGGDVVRLLYFTDGDVLGAASKLSEWSGFTTEDLERDQQGN